MKMSFDGIGHTASNALPNVRIKQVNVYKYGTLLALQFTHRRCLLSKVWAS